MATIPLLGTRWRKRPPGRETVEVHRVWYVPGQGWTVRAHPLRGGKPLIAAAHWFTTVGYRPVR